MFGRYVACLPPGFAVTAVLLFLMQQLVDGSGELPPRTDPPRVLGTAALPPPPPPTATPVPPQRIMPPPLAPEGGIPVEPEPDLTLPERPQGPPLPPPTDVGPGPGALPANGTLVCIVRVRPQYPPAAVTRGVDGQVTVAFDVLVDGRVANVRVTESTDRLFDREAIRAAGRFRFRPRVVDGQPVVTRDVRTSFRFEMDSGAR